MENKFITLGCRLNTFESEVIKEQLKNNKITNKVIINTCAVTEKAENDSLRQIKKLKRLFPNKEIIVTGCAVHTAAEKLKKMPEISKIISNDYKMSVNAFKEESSYVVNNAHTQSINTERNKGNYNIPTLNHFNTRTRAFVQIQQGCDHRCSFCIINKTRGKSLSLQEDDILRQVKKLINNGYKEITLTGVDISSWKRNIFDKTSKSKLGELCVQILKENSNLKRLRLSSLDPAVEDTTLLYLLANEERFMPHLHLSLQSMSNSVLNNMGRRHSKESARDWITKLKLANKSLVLGADIICGFPKETEEQFLDTYKTIKELNIPMLHVFPYSERSNTPAAKMEQIPQNIRKERALMLIDLANQLKDDFYNNKIGKVEEVLIESNNYGHTKDYSNVKILNKTLEKNTLVKTLLISKEKSFLIGESLDV